MKKFPLYGLAISLIVFIITFTMFINNPNKKENKVSVTVIDKIQGVHTGKKSRTTDRFYLILKDSLNRKFDILVSPTTFSQSYKNMKTSFMLNEYDINKNRDVSYIKDRLVFTLMFFSFFGLVISFIICTAMLLESRDLKDFKNV